jgi:hypothetical protein
MYGHIPQYLDAEKQRLRAERAEEQARRWRVTAYVLLVLLAAQTWLVIDTVMELTQARQSAEQQRDQVAVWSAQTADLQQQLRADKRRAEQRATAAEAALRVWMAVDMPTVLCSQQAADIDDARLAAEQRIRVCLSANAGLVDALHEFDALVKEQQSVIRESIELARRCEAQPATWVTRIPAISEVRW